MKKVKINPAHTSYWRGFVVGWMVGAGIALLISVRYAAETAQRNKELEKDG